MKHHPLPKPQLFLMHSRLAIFFVFILSSSLVFSQKNNRDIPRKTRRSIPLMVDHLTKDCATEQEKVDAIYEWITETIQYNAEVLESSKPLPFQTTRQTFLSKKAICNGYVNLMIDMLDQVNIKAEFIEGYTHTFEPDYDYILANSDHAWIAFQLDNKWYLADPTWDAGYIGRIPRPEKHYPKRWDKERSFKKEKKEEKWNKRIAKKKEEFDKKQAELDPYTDEIGFVQRPVKDHYMIHPDTFLLTHLPTLPQWQLREHSISMTQFCRPKDSIVKEIQQPAGDVLDFDDLNDEYISMNIIDKWLYTSKNGYLYNTENHGVKAVHNYNTVGVYLNSSLKKILNRYPDFKTTPIWEELIPKTDTAALHAKLALKKQSSNKRLQLSFYKSAFKSDATSQKNIQKAFTKLEKTIDKLNETCDSSKEKIKNNQATVDEKLAKYQSYYDRHQRMGDVEENSPEFSQLIASFDSIQHRIDSIDNSMKSYRSTPSLQGLMDHVTYSDYLTGYSKQLVATNNISTASEIQRIDSAIIIHLQLGKQVILDSIYNELLQKERFNAVKELERFVKSNKTRLRTLESERKITSASAIERQLFSTVYVALQQHQQEQLNSLAYNRYVLDNTSIIQKEVKKLKFTIKELEKAKEKRDKQSIKKMEDSFKRDENTFKMIQKRSKQWKNELKNRID